jgi:hypothetical protein
MSRQAGPSIILSVLIVSFFAVALFQHDLNRTRVGRTRSTLHKSVDNSPPSDPVSARFDQRRSMVHSSHVAEPAGVSAIRTDRSGYPNLPRVTQAPADFAGDAHEIRTGRISKPHTAISPLAYAPEALSGVERRSTSVKAVRGLTLKSSPAGIPRSAFTVALPSETIEDVSGRVYGTAEVADSLWRANRDTLPQHNSPLSGGMLLRTPRIQ